MNLKNKAEKYADDKESGWLYSYNGYIKGYKRAISDITEFLRVNPKATHQAITEYLEGIV